MATSHTPSSSPSRAPEPRDGCPATTDSAISRSRARGGPGVSVRAEGTTTGAAAPPSATVAAPAAPTTLRYNPQNTRHGNGSATTQIPIRGHSRNNSASQDLSADVDAEHRLRHNNQNKTKTESRHNIRAPSSSSSSVEASINRLKRLSIADDSVDVNRYKPAEMDMERYLREWRQDALNKAQYESAIYIGDKLLALTGSDDDAFWLAQVHFATGNYTRAQTFLSNQDLIARNASCRYLAGHCLVKQSRFEEALAILGEATPSHLLTRSSAATSNSNKRNRAQAKGANGRAATSGLARTVTDRSDGDDETPQATAARKCEAAMCHLRGICYAKQNAFDRAKECYKDAVRIDVQCFEAFQQLMGNNLLSPEEEWQFLDSLDFDSIKVAGSLDVSTTDKGASQEAAEFTRMLYTTRLSKYRNPGAFESAYGSLSTHYKLADNPDLLLARADMLHTQCRHRDALAVTTSVLARDKHNFGLYPIHIACLYELRMKNQLFLVAHELADSHPEESCTWLAVGTYYFLIDKIAEARRYFSKASMMDTHFGPAWIGFAHTFAAEGEHDQAISAYSTAARLFMGTHLPQVFLGMQNHALNNMTLAEEFLRTAYGLCRTDPLLLNEMGVVKYHQDQLKEAIQYFQAALAAAQDIESEPHAWIAVRTNLGHAYRRYGHHNRALVEFDDVLRLGGKDASVFTAKGLVLLEQGRPSDAVAVLHEALSLSPQDAIATELLNKALEETVLTDPLGAILGGGENDDGVSAQIEEEMAAFEQVLTANKAEASARMSARVRGGGDGGSPADGGDGKGKGRARASRAKGSRRVIVHEDEDVRGAALDPGVEGMDIEDE